MTTPAIRLTPPEVSQPAFDWAVDRWFNAPDDFGLDQLKGRVVALHAFQMLCPGCVSHGIPQAQRIQAMFPEEQVAVVGLHTVFEHHEAMRPESLAAFLYEYRVSFPVGVDTPSTDGSIPITMGRYAMRGTPSIMLIDRVGRLRLHAFGRPEDMAVGAAVAGLVAEPVTGAHTFKGGSAPEDDTGVVDGTCTPDGCST